MRLPLILTMATTLLVGGCGGAGDDAAGSGAASLAPDGFANCTACHSTQAGQNRVGPHLAGVVGRAAGSVDGANYSPAMQRSDFVWDEQTLTAYLLDPNAVVPGGSMPNPGLTEAEAQRIVAYLAQL